MSWLPIPFRRISHERVKSATSFRTGTLGLCKDHFAAAITDVTGGRITTRSFFQGIAICECTEAGEAQPTVSEAVGFSTLHYDSVPSGVADRSSLYRFNRNFSFSRAPVSGMDVSGQEERPCSASDQVSFLTPSKWDEPSAFLLLKAMQKY